MDITFACNKCGQSIEIDKDGAGQLVDCPRCRTLLEVPYRSVTPTVVSQAPSAPPLMQRNLPTRSNRRGWLVAMAVAFQILVLVIAYIGYTVWRNHDRQPFLTASAAAIEEAHRVQSGIRVGISAEAYNDKLVAFAAKVDDLKRVVAQNTRTQSSSDVRNLCDTLEGILTLYVNSGKRWNGISAPGGYGGYALLESDRRKLMQSFVYPDWEKAAQLTDEADKLYSRLK